MTDKSLRERCIDKLVPFVDFDGAIPPEEVVSAKAHNAGLALDAVLGVLTEHADEWIDATGPLEWHDWSERVITHGLLAVLGGDGGGVR